MVQTILLIELICFYRYFENEDRYRKINHPPNQ